MKNFKKWFKLMWKNGYIIIFLVATGALIYTILKSEEIIAESGLFWLLFALLIPSTVIFCISYFAFYRFWEKIKNNDIYGR